MAASLEKLIKELEFENEDLLRQIKDEISQIDGMQKDISIKTQENSKLEKDVVTLNEETKSLHEHFKQNKEITESLKNATSLLGRHSEDLKKTLQLKKEDTKLQCQEHGKVLQKYSEKWDSYREEYEERPLAQVTRKLQLEAASLDIEEKKIGEERHELEKQVQAMENDKVKWKKEKEDAIDIIMNLAQTRVNTKRMVSKIIEIKNEKVLKEAKLEEECKILQEISLNVERIHLSQNAHSKAKNEECQKEAMHQQQVTHSNSNNIQQQSTETNKSSMAHKKSKFVKLSQPKPFHLPKLPQLKLPKMPKFPSFTKSPQVKPAAKRIDTPQNITPKIIDAQVPTTNLSPINNVIENPKTPQPDENMIYNIPLDQPSKEFFGEKSGMNTNNNNAPATPGFSFSPGQHAEKLKLLKQSPATGYLHTTRPMFEKENQDEQNVSMEYQSDNNDFSSSFCSQNQFMGNLTNSQTEPCNTSQLDSAAFSILPTQQNNEPAVAIDSVFVAPSSSSKMSSDFSFDMTNRESPHTSSNFSFDSPNSGFPYQTAPPSAPTNPVGGENGGMFHFGSTMESPKTDFSSPNVENGGSMFFFGKPNTESANTSFSLGEGGSDFNFDTGNKQGGGDSSMFDFSIKSQNGNGASSDVNMFNFGSPSPNGGKERGAFSFGTASPSSTPTTNNNAFSFNF